LTEEQYGPSTLAGRILIGRGVSRAIWAPQGFKTVVEVAAAGPVGSSFVDAEGREEEPSSSLLSSSRVLISFGNGLPKLDDGNVYFAPNFDHSVVVVVIAPD
jgi:hypothetical protein